MATAEITVTETASPLTNTWWVVLLEGIAAIIIGLLLLSDPSTTLVTLMIFLGVWWFVGGLLDLVRLFVDRTDWGWKLASGILGIVAGLAVVRHPLWASVLVPAALVWILAAIGIVIGAIALFRAFKGDGWGTGILGVISIIFGILLFGANPFVTTTILTYLVAGWAIVGGILAIFVAFRLRSDAR